MRPCLERRAAAGSGQRSPPSLPLAGQVDDGAAPRSVVRTGPLPGAVAPADPRSIRAP